MRKLISAILLGSAVCGALLLGMHFAGDFASALLVMAGCFILLVPFSYALVLFRQRAEAFIELVPVEIENSRYQGATSRYEVENSRYNPTIHFNPNNEPLILEGVCVTLPAHETVSSHSRATLRPQDQQDQDLAFKDKVTLTRTNRMPVNFTQKLEQRAEPVSVKNMPARNAAEKVPAGQIENSTNYAADEATAPFIIAELEAELRKLEAWRVLSAAESLKQPAEIGSAQATSTN